jgi:hypothetical protein
MIKIPAITKEVDFVGRYATAIEEVLDSGKGSLLDLTEKVVQRAESDVESTLRKLEEQVSHAAKSILRIEWINTSRGSNWHSKARLFVPMGPKKRIGSVGLYLDNEPMPIRLLGWVWPSKGGLDGRRELVRACRKKLRSDVLLASEHVDRFPGWADDDGIIWYEEGVSLRTSLEDLAADLKEHARKFFKCSAAVLTRLAE